MPLSPTYGSEYAAALLWIRARLLEDASVTDFVGTHVAEWVAGLGTALPAVGIQHLGASDEPASMGGVRVWSAHQFRIFGVEAAQALTPALADLAVDIDRLFHLEDRAVSSENDYGKVVESLRVSEYRMTLVRKEDHRLIQILGGVYQIRTQAVA